MPKRSNFPTLYSDALQISITKLKEWEYLNPDQMKFGSIEWSRNGKTRASISIASNMLEGRPFVQCDYNFNDQPRNYMVYLTSNTSNLNNGKIWYFICPHTKKSCRKLY